MNISRDIAIVVMVSVLGLIYTVTIGQLPLMLTGIPGSNYLFYIGYAILVSFALLMYEGRRWRYLLQGILVGFLFLPTYSTGMPFDILSRIPTMGSALIADVLFNSVYGYFDRKKIIRYWAILSTLGACLIQISLMILTRYLYYSSAFVALFVSVTLILMPVIVIENVFGALIGYKIYRRVKKLQ